VFLRAGLEQSGALLEHSSGSRELVAALANGLQSDAEMFEYLAELLMSMGITPVAFMVRQRAAIIRKGLHRMAEEATN
jgi:hypothetical protein